MDKHTPVIQFRSAMSALINDLVDHAESTKKIEDMAHVLRMRKLFVLGMDHAHVDVIQNVAKAMAPHIASLVEIKKNPERAISIINSSMPQLSAQIDKTANNNVQMANALVALTKNYITILDADEIVKVIDRVFAAYAIAATFPV